MVCRESEGRGGEGGGGEAERQTDLGEVVSYFFHVAFLFFASGVGRLDGWMYVRMRSEGVGGDVY